MDLNLNNLTFVIVTYNSEEVIDNCLKSLPKEASKIIIENSKNIETKNYLEKNYDNIKVFCLKMKEWEHLTIKELIKAILNLFL